MRDIFCQLNDLKKKKKLAANYHEKKFKNSQEIFNDIQNMTRTIAQSTLELSTAAEQTLNPIPADCRMKFRPLENEEERNVKEGESPQESYWRRTLMDMTGKLILNEKNV